MPPDEPHRHISPCRRPSPSSYHCPAGLLVRSKGPAPHRVPASSDRVNSILVQITGVCRASAAPGRVMSGAPAAGRSEWPREGCRRSDQRDCRHRIRETADIRSERLPTSYQRDCRHRIRETADIGSGRLPTSDQGDCRHRIRETADI